MGWALVLLSYAALPAARGKLLRRASLSPLLLCSAGTPCTAGSASRCSGTLHESPSRHSAVLQPFSLLRVRADAIIWQACCAWLRWVRLILNRDACAALIRLTHSPLAASTLPAAEPWHQRPASGP